MNDRKYRRELEARAEAHWSDWSLSMTHNQQYRLTLRQGSHQRSVFAALTPGDHRNLKNFERDVRHAVRELKDLPA